MLLTKYTTPAGIRRAGESRIATWLRNQGCCNARNIAAKAIVAANAQHTVVQAQEVGADLVAALARTILDLHDQVTEIDNQIEDRFREHQHAQILLSMPGLGTLLASEVLAATGGDVTAYDSASRLAGAAGPGARAPRLRTHQRQQPPPQTLRPKTPQRLLPGRPISGPLLPRKPQLLPTQTN